MVLEFPSLSRTATGLPHALPWLNAADALPRRADLQQLMLQLQRVGDGGHSAGLQAALHRLGCRSEHEAMLQLLQWLLARPAVDGDAD